MRPQSITTRETPQLFTRFLVLALLAALIGTLLTVQPARAAQSSQEANPVVIYMFWGDGCPHCAKAKPFLEELAARNPNVELLFY